MEMKVKIDTKELDIAIEKAERLNELLSDAQNLIYEMAGVEDAACEKCSCAVGENLPADLLDADTINEFFKALTGHSFKTFKKE